MKKKINCLHLVYSGLGGASSTVFSLIEAKKKKLNHSIFFIGPKFLNDFKFKSEKLNIKFIWIKTIKFFYLISFIKTCVKLFKYKPDLILIHNYYLMPCIFYKFFFRNTKIFYINHKSVNLISWKDLFFKYFINFVDKIICLNNETLIYFKKFFSIYDSKFCLISNGINTNYFKRNGIKKKQKKFVIGMACRINKLKFYDLISKSLKSDLLKDLNIQFSLAGTGEDLENFKKRIIKMNLEKKIKCLGYLDEVALKKWYRNLDLYIQASVGEGMPISLLQAMSINVPVIGSRVSGTKTLLKKKNVGLLFNNNIDDLAKKISFFYYLSEKRKLIFANSQRRFVLTNHSYKVMFNKYYNEIKKAFNI